MKNALVDRILSETPPEVKQYVRRYAEITVRIHELLDEKGWSQRDLAQKLGKNPAEINKWLRGDHNFTLQTLCKIEVELGQDILEIYCESRKSTQKTIFKGAVSFKNPETVTSFKKATVIPLKNNVQLRVMSA
jgi:transcriptional regulator with XRE-family HTH domain